MFLLLLALHFGHNAVAMCTFPSITRSETAQGLLQPMIKEYQDAAEGCSGWASKASRGCVSEGNPKFESASAAIGTIMTAVGTAASSNMQMACSGFGEALKIATAAVGAFRVECGGLKVYCESKCTDAVKKLGDVRKFISGNKAKPPPNTMASDWDDDPCISKILSQAGSVEDATGIDRTDRGVQANLKTCEGYSKTLAEAGVNLFQFAGQSMVVAQCESQTSDAVTDACKTNPDLPLCASKMDCSKSANANTQTCICKANPRDPACQSSGQFDNLVTAGTLSKVNGAVATSGSSGPTDAQLRELARTVDDSNSDGFGGVEPGKNSGANTNSPGSAKGGAMPNGLSPGGLTAAAGKLGANGAAVAGRFNTNTIGGLSGGGGSSGFSSSSGRGSSSGAGAERNPASSGFNYRAYLPGGAKAGPGYKVNAAGLVDGITGPAGKSLWEKVSERYRDNRRTLLPE
jgi:hypothetical protein